MGTSRNAENRSKKEKVSNFEATSVRFGGSAYLRGLGRWKTPRYQFEGVNNAAHLTFMICDKRLKYRYQVERVGKKEILAVGQKRQKEGTR